jgi:hypothetical protein
MLEIRSDPEKHILYITLAGRFEPADARGAANAVIAEAARMGTGFDVISDIRRCHPGDADSLVELGRALVHLKTHGMRRAVRVTQIVLTALQVGRVSKEVGYDSINVFSLGEAEKLLASPVPGLSTEEERKWERMRLYRRAPVGPDHTVRFAVRGQPFNSVRITNLSAQGCFAVMEHKLAHHLDEGTVLFDFALEHPRLPSTTLTAKIVRAVRHLSEISDDDLGMGVMFLAPPPRFIERVDSYVAACCAAEV